MLEKTFDPRAVEARLYQMWEEGGWFRPKDDPAAKPFCIVIPPPNVTGRLHMGHALNNTLQDVLIRYRRMRGDRVLWQPGTDHAGIATQMVVEREIAKEGLSRAEMGREAFLERVWAWKEESGGQIIDQLKRLGSSCDWSRERFTMDEGLSSAVLKTFVDWYEKGLIYRGKRLVNWDPKFQTAISDLEVENIEVDGHMWRFKYPLAGGETYDYVEKDADGNVTLRETRDYIAIATTRPETMLGDGAVAVHPGDERYRPIVGKLCEIPVGPKEHRRLIPIITDEYPDPDFGSGAVKITGAHDFNDYGVAKRNGVPCYRLMDAEARMRGDGAPYAEAAAIAQAVARGARILSEAEADALNLVPEAYRGLDRYEARKRVVADITAEGLAVMVPNPAYDPGAQEPGPKEIPFVEAKKIMQPFGDRSGVVIEPMLTDQWFVDAATLAKPALEAVRAGDIKFHPENWAKTYYQWLENIEPWCISRQLWWGHQIPAWFDADGDFYVAETEDAALAKAREAKGEGVTLTRDPDVLDTWFSSQLWPFSTLGWPEETPELQSFYPGAVLITAFDIIFFWVARMIMAGLDLRGEKPFSDVVITALVRDEKGRKMSKSKGNVIDPLELIEEYGADALRFTIAAMAGQGRDIKFAKSRVEGYRNFGTKLWNAARFAEMNGCAARADFDPAAVTGAVNTWIVAKTKEAAGAIAGALDAFRFDDAAAIAYRHVWNVLCDWHLELSKPVLQGPDGPAKAEAQATTAWAIEEACRLLHPFMPFITEELWEATGAKARAGRPLIGCDWLDHGDLAEDAGAAADIAWVVGLVSEIRSARGEMNVPTGAKPDLVAVGADAETRRRLETYAGAIAFLGRTGETRFADAAPTGCAQVVHEGAVFALPLEGLIDLAAERARLQKEITKTEGEISRLDKKLSNAKFVDNAPADVVATEREKRAGYESRREKLGQALARLG